ncbi:keratin, type I cytoskeletal 9-like isoform X4 [Homarus americanus]|uniref:keratin, type I cytoskeletal 9-like isoform X4 n=1 Tax=Homarus americanus TaxID=6706 RepID=UPI001C45B4A3|nr:keratin, type I cytoskeletal 9-like isoform X4 [Homarus americanus]
MDCRVLVLVAACLTQVTLAAKAEEETVAGAGAGAGAAGTAAAAVSPAEAVEDETSRDKRHHFPYYPSPWHGPPHWSREAWLGRLRSGDGPGDFRSQLPDVVDTAPHSDRGRLTGHGQRYPGKGSHGFYPYYYRPYPHPYSYPPHPGHSYHYGHGHFDYDCVYPYPHYHSYGPGPFPRGQLDREQGGSGASASGFGTGTRPQTSDSNFPSDFSSLQTPGSSRPPGAVADSQAGATSYSNSFPSRPGPSGFGTGLNTNTFPGSSFSRPEGQFGGFGTGISDDSFGGGSSSFGGGGSSFGGGGSSFGGGGSSFGDGGGSSSLGGGGSSFGGGGSSFGGGSSSLGGGGSSFGGGGSSFGGGSSSLDGGFPSSTFNTGSGADTSSNFGPGSTDTTQGFSAGLSSQDSKQPYGLSSGSDDTGSSSLGGSGNFLGAGSPAAPIPGFGNEIRARDTEAASQKTKKADGTIV